MKHRSPALAGSVLALLVALFVAAAPSQLAAQSQGNETMPEAPEIDDGELETFAEIYLEVAEVRTSMQQELQGTQDQAAAREIQQSAQTEMRAILDESDLTIERYTQIGQVLNTDPEQRAEFQAIVRELQEEGGGGTLR